MAAKFKCILSESIGSNLSNLGFNADANMFPENATYRESNLYLEHYVIKTNAAVVWILENFFLIFTYGWNKHIL